MFYFLKRLLKQWNCEKCCLGKLHLAIFGDHNKIAREVAVSGCYTWQFLVQLVPQQNCKISCCLGTLHLAILVQLVPQQNCKRSCCLGTLHLPIFGATCITTKLQEKLLPRDVTLGNFRCNLYHNKIAREVAVLGCYTWQFSVQLVPQQNCKRSCCLGMLHLAIFGATCTTTKLQDKLLSWDVTLGNFQCNLYHNKIAREVAVLGSYTWQFWCNLYHKIVRQDSGKIA